MGEQALNEIEELKKELESVKAHRDQLIYHRTILLREFNFMKDNQIPVYRNLIDRWSAIANKMADKHRQNFESTGSKISEEAWREFQKHGNA